MAKVPTSPQDRSPFADRLPAFIDALEVLYIRNNVSGRNKFRELWPHAARYIFGEALTRYDLEGGLDRDTRATEEEQAEDRRTHLVSHLEEVRHKSIESSILQLRYIESVIHELGRDIAEDIFSGWVIEKIFPPAPPVTTPPPFHPNLALRKRIVETKRKKAPSYREIAAWAEKIFSKSITNAFNSKATA